EHTADFDTDTQNIVRIYRRLSAASGLLPPAIGFLFDRESRTDQMITDLAREGHGKIAFLERRMFENYLLHPPSIAKLMAELPNFRPTVITPEEIDTWITDHRSDERFILKGDIDRWFQRVDGARLLSTLFEELSETRYIYRKIEYGLKLTRFILASAPAEFSEV